MSESEKSPAPADVVADDSVAAILLDAEPPPETSALEDPPSSKAARRLNVGRATRRHLRAIRMVLNALMLLALNPIVAFGTRIRLPRWLTASVLMIGLIVGIGTGVGLLAQPAIGWFHGAPTAIRSFVPKLRSFTKPLEAANRATQTLVSGNSRAVVPQSTPISISAWDVVSTAPKVLAAVLSVLLLVFFFLIYGDSMLRRLVEITPSFAYKRHAVTIVRGIQTEVSRYLLTALLINASVGAVTAGMLWLYKVPDPLLWGAVAMFANFIPYVGAIVTTTVLALVCMLYANDASLEVFLPVLTFAGITAVEGNLITPLIQGASMRLSPIAILLWLLVWGWLWGIPGALLAVPMLTCTKLITERVRGWEWFAHIVQR